MKEDQLVRLLSLIEDQLDWGDPANWPSKDFEKLNVLIQEKTKISLSASTLRRVWGKVDYNNRPSVTTLDTLAQFAGYESWRAFCSYRKEATTVKPPGVSQIKKSTFGLRYLMGVLVLAVIIVIVSVALTRSGRNVNEKNYSFSYRPVTHDLPNSVIFTYDAHTAPNDSVFIQQSWDNSRRARVAKNAHQFSSIYYKPGFYHAKLVVGTQIVKESPLLIPTNGWLGMIDEQPVPVYLDQHEFMNKSGMSVSTATILNHKVPLEPQPPVVSFYNTGNFKPVSILDFSYTAEVRNSYKTGASRCQQLNMILFTSNIPISIPLSEPGCIASLSMLDGVKEVDGSTADLSVFGTDLSKWVKLTCISKAGKISIFVDDKLGYQYRMDDKNMKIMGVGFLFHGTGDVRHVKLSSGDTTVFQSF